MKKIALTGLIIIALTSCDSKGLVESITLNSEHWIEASFGTDGKIVYKECILNKNKLPLEKTGHSVSAKVCRDVSKDTYTNIKNKFMDGQIFKSSNPEALLPGKSLGASEVAVASSK